jgi:hypothetical protein
VTYLKAKQIHNFWYATQIINVFFLYFRVLHPVARNIKLKIIILSFSQQGHIIKYFVNCCEKEGIIIYSLVFYLDYSSYFMVKNAFLCTLLVTWYNLQYSYFYGACEYTYIHLFSLAYDLGHARENKHFYFFHFLSYGQFIGCDTWNNFQWLEGGHVPFPYRFNYRFICLTTMSESQSTSVEL